ncbi:S8 family serine peptidase [Kitasatospora mediocidica]|uniref:S8 family serine peptidase n=1 Tax=Kitasatospora mediocidica TaxID=58352 RepID=UPI00069249E0|nr:S8 family serine peptidase [Kitasatospora mediocidica]
MTHRSAPAALAALCGLLLVPLAPGPARADTPLPATGAPATGAPATGAPVAGASAGAEPSSLPTIGQTNSAFQQQGCLHASARSTDLTPWAQTFLRPDAAWSLSQGAGVTVAVLGSGVDGTSGVFGGRLALGPREYGPGDSGRDCVGHGTFLAGLIAAGRQSGVGFAGVAPAARILAVAITDDVGNTAADQVSRGIRAAADGGARVIDLAMPLPPGSGQLADALHYADGKGALVIVPATVDPSGASAGAAAAQAPTAPDVLAVADLGPGGAPAQSPSQSAAPASPAAARVDLVAPGDSVMSVGPGGVGYFTGTGPSFAAAFVAGTAALVLGYRPELTTEQLVHRLEATAYHPGTALPDPQLGYGTVDPVAAVSAVLPEEHGTAPAPTPSAASTAMPPVRPQPAGRQAASVAGGALGVAVLVGCAAVVLPRGRRRSWRPGPS